MKSGIWLVLTAIGLSLAGIVYGLYLGGNLLFQTPEQFNTKTTTTETVTVAKDSHGKYTQTIVTAVTETTPHEFFHDFVNRMQLGTTTLQEQASVPDPVGDEIWVLTQATLIPPKTTGLSRKPNEIGMGSGEFMPGSITVPVGTTVTWTNSSGEFHTVTSISGLFNGAVESGYTFSYTFTDVGVYSYFCEPHSGMAGTVIVQ